LLYACWGDSSNQEGHGVRAKITKRIVDAAGPETADVFIWDSELRGFGLKVTPKGRKVYLVQYRLPGAATRRYTIGAHGSPWTPDLARDKALEVLAAVAAGQDPADARREAKSDISISELCDLYLAEGVRTKKASTIEMDLSRIGAHVRPLLGAKRLKQLSKSDIDRFLSDVAAGKTARQLKTRPRGRSVVRGGPGVANRTLGMLGGILQFAVEKGMRPDNPARHVKKFKEGKRSRFLSNEEIARLGEALRQAATSGANPYAIAAIRLLLLTGCRKNEILGLRWDEVDIGGGFLRLSDSKTGAKNVYLPAPAKAVLAEIPRQHGNPYVICGDSPTGHFIGIHKVWSAVRNSAGLLDIRIHDLRHSFASVGARSGESLLVIGKVLGHATSAATGRYAHLSQDPAQTAAERIGQVIADQLKREPLREAN
jgi:integrase